MGAWGPAIMSCDEAVDLRDEYREALADGATDEAALAQVRASYAVSFDDADEGPGLRIALALCMHKLGRLTPEVLAEALAAIDAGPDPRWDTPALARSRAAALAKARATLEAPQRAKTKIRARFKEHTSLKPGDALAFEHAGKTTLLRVIALEENKDGISPVVRTLRWRGAGVPPSWRLRMLRDEVILTVTLVGAGGSRRVVPSGTHLFRHSSRDADFDAAGFRIVGRVPTRRRDAVTPANGAGNWESAAEQIRDGSWWHPANATWYGDGASIDDIAADIAAERG